MTRLGLVINMPCIQCLQSDYLCSHKTCKVQIYIGKTVQTVLLSEMLLILFTDHFFLQNGILLKPPNVTWITQM